MEFRNFNLGLVIRFSDFLDSSTDLIFKLALEVAAERWYDKGRKGITHGKCI